MKKRIVLDHNCLPSRLPIWTSATAWLLLDRFSPSGWVWGAVGCFFLLLWIVAIWAVVTQEKVNPLDPEEQGTDPAVKSKWQQRLEELQAQQKAQRK